jgi:hypothetical protein
LSALRVNYFSARLETLLTAAQAVNALEGRIFNGNTITALFYDAEAFERGIYEK